MTTYKPVQRWDYRGGVYTRRGQPNKIPPTAAAAGLLFRASVTASASIAGRLYRAELDSTSTQSGRLYRAEIGAAAQTTVTTVPLSSFERPGDTFEQALLRLTVDTIVDLEGRTVTFADFDESAVYGIYNPHAIGFYNGTMEMQANTSTHAAAINAQGSGSTVQETLVRIGRGTSQVTRGYMGSVTILATPQGSIYNGLNLFTCTDTVVENCTILGIPGSASAPPGETFPLNNYKGTNITIRNVMIDGQGVSATGIGHNQANGILVQDSTFQNMGHGAGVSEYLCTNITYERCTFQNNHSSGANFEKQNGTTITMNSCTFHNNGHNMIVDTDGTSSIVHINDPIWDGMNTGVPFKVCVHTNYAYPPVANPPPNKQLPSDIHLYFNGVETPSRLQVTTN